MSVNDNSESCHAEEKKSVSYPALKEFAPQTEILTKIPARAQRNLLTLDISLTCLDVVKEYVAIGSSVGIVYLYDRKKDKLHKLRNEDYTDPVTCVKVLVSLECLVVFGSKKGIVWAFKVPFPEENEQEKFTIEGLHSAPITALEWAKNGMKFFSGDASGVVVCTNIDHLEHQSKSYIVMDENNEIVQLSYTKMTLLVSTLHRSLLYSFKENKCLQVGQKDRKCTGKFGAIFFSDNANMLYACRPGQRLWKVDNTGMVLETIILKTALLQPHPNMQLLQPFCSCSQLKDFQFGKLKKYDGKYLLTWSDSSLVLLDPEMHTVVASCCDMNPIVDVATSEDEIFILQGLRHLIRVAVYPENVKDKSKDNISSTLSELIVPSKILEPILKEKDFSMKIHNDNSPAIFGWLKKRFSEPSGNSSLNSDDYRKDSISSIVDDLPDVVKLDSESCLPIQVHEPPPPLLERDKLIGEIKSASIDFSEDIVVKRKKKRKHKVHKVRFSEDEVVESGSFSSLPGSVPQNECPDMLNVNANDSALCDINDNVNKSDDAVDEPINSVKEDGKALLKSNLEKIKFIVNDEDELLKNILDKYSQLKHVGDEAQDIKENNSSSNVNSAAEDLNSSKNECAVNVKENDTEGELAIKEETKLSLNLNSSETSSITKICDGPSSPESIYSSAKFATARDESDSRNNSKTTSSNNPDKCSEIKNSLTFSDSCLLSEEISENDLPKYGVDWVHYNAPASVISLSVSSYHVFCVDNRNRAYCSVFPTLGFEWKELQQPGEQIAVSPSETVLWILYKGSVYAAKRDKNLCIVDWIIAARNIAYIAVDDSCAWYISDSGSLFTQQNLTASAPYNYPENVPSQKICQVACRNGVIWILTSEGKLFCRMGVSATKPVGITWKEIKLDCIQAVCTFALGIQQVAWIVDSTGTVWFRVGIDSLSPEGDANNMWQVESSNYEHETETQLRKTMKKIIPTDMLSNLIRGEPVLCLVAGQSHVWYCTIQDNVIYSNQKDVIGHAWDVVIPVGSSMASKWHIISAEGIISFQGFAWCLRNTGELYCFSVNTKDLFLIEPPTTVPLICIHAARQSLWVLSSDGAIYVRQEITENNPQGLFWQSLNLNQLSSITLSHISCSTEVVWACDVNGHCYLRMGTLKPSTASSLSQAWIEVDSDILSSSVHLIQKFSAVGKHFPLPLVHPNSAIITKVYVGPKHFMLWSIDSNGCVYARDGITAKYPIGDKWILVPGPRAKQLCISKNAVWLLKYSGKIYRRFRITEKNVVGDYWKQIPGKLDFLSVTNDDDLWGVHEGLLFCHSSYVLKSERTSQSKSEVDKVIDDDWEEVEY